MTQVSMLAAAARPIAEIGDALRAGPRMIAGRRHPMLRGG